MLGADELPTRGSKQKNSSHSRDSGLTPLPRDQATAWSLLTNAEASVPIYLYLTPIVSPLPVRVRSGGRPHGGDGPDAGAVRG